MSKKEDIEEFKKLMKEKGMDFEEYLEAKKAHLKRIKRLDEQLLASKSESKMHFMEEEE